MDHLRNPTVEDVRNFWENNPLWTGESELKAQTKEFYEEHRRVVIDDCLGGSLDDRMFPHGEEKECVLDLGCGPGFWTVELGRRGCGKLFAADLTKKALELARTRCELFGVAAEFSQQNAEKMTFPDGYFTHVNCHGVIHHTPQTEQCVSEIARVLRPGGSISLSVYYQNVALRMWPALRRVGKILADSGAALKGRGRENIFRMQDASEIVRMYDGNDNPVGKAYTRDQFHAMLKPYFDITQTFLHFFPARALPFKIPKPVHKVLDSQFGFMIYVRGFKR